MPVEKTLENSFKLPLLIITGGTEDVENEIGNCSYYNDSYTSGVFSISDPRYKTCRGKATFVTLSTWTLRHAFRDALDIGQRHALRDRSEEDGTIKCVHHMMQHGMEVIASVCAISVHTGHPLADGAAVRFVMSMTNIHRPVYVYSTASIPHYVDLFCVRPLAIIEKSRPILRQGVLPYGKQEGIQ